MRLKSLALFIGAVLLSSVSAQAGSFKDDPVYAPGFNWSGGYIGVHVGGAWGDSDWTYRGDSGPVTDRGAACPGANGCNPSHHISGWVGGGQIGWLAQSGSVVYGVEGSLSGGEIDGRSRSILGAADDVFRTDIDFLASAAFRIGVASDRFLLSAKIGYAGANVETSVVDTVGGNQGRANTNEWHSGLLLGAGVDYAITNNVILGIDYSFYGLGSERHNRTFNGGGGTVNDKVDLDIHTVTARLNYKF